MPEPLLRQQTSPGTTRTTVPAPIAVQLPTAAATVAFGTRLAALLRAGDLVLLTGDLGAGKTTLAQGIGAGLRVRGPITSPTFVLARRHPSLVDGPDLVHVDAYRIGSALELDDLDLDTDLDSSVVVVEWGTAKAEQLSGNRLEVFLEGAEGRTAVVRGVGPRWSEPRALQALPETATVRVT